MPSLACEKRRSDWDGPVVSSTWPLTYIICHWLRQPAIPSSPCACCTILGDVPAALQRDRSRAAHRAAAYVLEYANKRNLKAIARYLARTAELVAVCERALRVRRAELRFPPGLDGQRAAHAPVTDAKPNWPSRIFASACSSEPSPPKTLAALDGALQRVGAAWKLSPSVFCAGATASATARSQRRRLFRCPRCRSHDSEPRLRMTLGVRGMRSRLGPSMMASMISRRPIDQRPGQA